MKVPQHLELGDVVAWGLSATDLVFSVAGIAAAWWLYLALPGDPGPRLLIAAPPALAGLGLGVIRLGELALRDWLRLAAPYALRPRVFVTGGIP